MPQCAAGEIGVLAQRPDGREEDRVIYRRIRFFVRHSTSLSRQKRPLGNAFVLGLGLAALGAALSARAAPPATQAPVGVGRELICRGYEASGNITESQPGRPAHIVALFVTGKSPFLCSQSRDAECACGLAEDAAGRILCDGQWTTYTTRNSGLAFDLVLGVAEAPDGSIWFATGRGVSRLDPERAAR